MGLNIEITALHFNLIDKNIVAEIKINPSEDTGGFIFEKIIPVKIESEDYDQLYSNIIEINNQSMPHGQYILEVTKQIISQKVPELQQYLS